MPRLFSTNLEKKAIKFVCSDNKHAKKFLATIDESFFQRNVTKTAFKRIKKVMKSKGEVPSYNDLVEDPGLDESVRLQLKDFTAKTPKSAERANQLFEQLDEYRVMREAFSAAKNVIEELNKPTVDIEAVIKTFTEALDKSRSSRGLPKISIGDSTRESDALVKAILTGKDDDVIPTGIKAFDDINRGFFKGSLVILAGNTGAGKSTLAGQLAFNMASTGIRVCIYSLEMTQREEMQRTMARASGVSMTKIINPRKMTREEKVRVYKAMKKLRRKFRKAGGIVTFVTPDRDLTIEEALYSLGPYDYDVIIVDYITLLKDLGGEDQAKALGSAARFAKVFAKNKHCLVILLAQLNEEGLIKYSRAIREHANNMWAFLRDDKAKESGVIRVQQQKARNQRDFPFDLLERYDIMTISDVPKDYVPPEPQNDNNGNKKKKVPERKYKL